MLPLAKKLLLLSVALMVIVAAGCGPKAAKPTSELDSPEYHYNQGLKYLGMNRPMKRCASFSAPWISIPNRPWGISVKASRWG